MGQSLPPSSDGSLGLSPGARLDRYEIIAFLGEGGMGRVYRAHDPRLGRDVALKILLRRDARPEDLARFGREARAAGSLNHPNIVAVHDVGTDGVMPYVVMELLEGETLRERLGRGRLPLRKALDYGIQIAHALDAAHAKGIWHRDVKPGNAFITHDGRVKLLDFGIAKLSERAFISQPDDTTEAVSESGQIIGTAGYMSPEQVRGQPVDHRTDIFAFGAVLYEMLTGARAFKRATKVETLTAVLQSDPVDPMTLNADIPPLVAAVVRRCLEKNQEERFQSARDLAFDLQHVAEGTGSTGRARAPASFARRRTLRRILEASLLLAAGVSAGLLLARPPSLAIYDEYQLLPGGTRRVTSARFANEAGVVVYGEEREGSDVELQRFDVVDKIATPALGDLDIAADIMAAHPREYAVLTDRRFLQGERFVGTLKRVPLGGGAPQPVAENVEDADWYADGELAIVRSQSGVSGKSWLEYPVGTPLYETEAALRFPRVSPDGQRIAFLEDGTNRGAAGIVKVVEVGNANAVRPLTAQYESVSGLAWSADGLEIWFSAGEDRANRTLRAVNLDGLERRVLSVSIPDSLTLWDISRDGRLLISLDEDRRFTVGVAPGENEEREISWREDTGVADLSSDGQLIVFGSNSSVFLGRTDGSAPQSLGLTHALADAISPDGKFVLATTDGGLKLMLKPTGSGKARQLPSGGIVSHRGARFFGDSQRILVNGKADGGALRSYIQDISGGALPQELTTPGTWGLSVSQNGKWVAAITADDDGQGISLWPVDGGTPREVKNSRDGDRPVAWSNDDRFLWVFRRDEVPAPVFQLDIATGERTFWKNLTPPDRNGVYAIIEFTITPTGNAYFYSYKRQLSKLYVAGISR